MRVFNFIYMFVVVTLLIPLMAYGAPINWHSWNEEAFEKAKQHNKIIFLDVGTEWCSACNQMQHETYEDSDIQNFINDNFIAIHVDAEAEPDLGERYGFWGWPALIFISPQGDHVGFHRGFRPADIFSMIIKDLNNAHVAGKLETPDIEVDLVSAPSTDDFVNLVNLGNQMLDRFYDTENNSWGGSRMADPYLFKQAWWRSKSKDQQIWSQRAQHASEQYLKLVDPVWGGVWFGSGDEAFNDNYIYEKRAEHQAGAINIFAQAYKNDPQQTWINAANEVIAYIDTFLKSETGGYYTSQEMHIIGHNTEISPKDYFKLDDTERRAIGMPEIDTTQYTDINAKLVLAFSQLYEVTGDKQWRERALSLMTYLHTASSDRGHYRQIIGVENDAQRARKLPEFDKPLTYLRTQAYAGLASLASFQISGNTDWLTHAHKIAEVITADLLDSDSGGLYGSSRQTIGPDGNKLGDQPLIDTGAAAEFFNRLSAHTYGAFDDYGNYNSKQYRQFAEQSLRAVAQPARLRVQGNFIGQYVLALHQYKDEFAQVSVVCPQTEHIDCQNLYTTSLIDLTHPRRIVKLQKPGYYPDRGPANLFICNSTACSSPIAHDDPELLPKARRWFDVLDGSTTPNRSITNISTATLNK